MRSPRLLKPVTVDFPEAIRAIIEDKHVTKREWENIETYGCISEGLLCLHKAGEPANQFHSWVVNDGDLLGTDWIVLD